MMRSNIYLISVPECKERINGAKAVFGGQEGTAENFPKLMNDHNYRFRKPERNPGQDRLKEIHIMVKLQNPYNKPKMLKSQR